MLQGSKGIELVEIVKDLILLRREAKYLPTRQLLAGSSSDQDAHHDETTSSVDTNRAYPH